MNFFSACLYLLNANFTDMYHHGQFMRSWTWTQAFVHRREASSWVTLPDPYNLIDKIPPGSILSIFLLQKRKVRLIWIKIAFSAYSRTAGAFYSQGCSQAARILTINFYCFLVLLAVQELRCIDLGLGAFCVPTHAVSLLIVLWGTINIYVL